MKKKNIEEETFEKEWIDVIKRVPEILEQKLSLKALKNLCYAFFLAGNSFQLDNEIRNLEGKINS